MATLAHSEYLNLYRAARRRRLGKRFLGVIAAALALATMAYGETWLLEQAPRTTLECAVSTGVAQAIETAIAAD